MAGLGYNGLSNDALQEFGGDMAVQLGRRQVDKHVSICWLYRFLQRWRSRFVSKTPSTLDSNRARYSIP
ncbi:hypothetical protein DPMN_091316 [Dreissena polymorpha]|uniref:Uncharacterized protein n=1 Tax=Dreissena polymorpha TaxID=45954 RepID=A0A9D4KZQ4_DREPO|nr:hypothetical protein DPMN_091316 [Dreissena polymorpha]